MSPCSRQMGEGRVGRSTRAGYCREGEIVMLPIRRTRVSRMGVTGIGWGRGYYTGDSWQGEDLTMRGRMTRPGGGWGKIGRASCRERVEISVVAGSLKKKKTQ